MKKIFGVLSLIAILTVAFTSQASAEPDNHVEYVVSFDSPDLVAVDFISVESGVFNVADVSVNSASASVEDLADNAIIYFGNLIVYKSNEFEIEPLPDLNKYISNYNSTYGYDSPDLIKDISTNVGKLTRLTLHI